MFHYLESQTEWLRTNTDKHRHPNLEVYDITASWTVISVKEWKGHSL